MSSDHISVGCFVTQYPYPGQFRGDNEYFCSGAERVARNLSEAVNGERFDVSAVTSSSAQRYETMDQNGVTVYRSPSFHTINTTELAPTLLIDRLSERFDIVHAHNSTPPGGMAAVCYAAVHDVPLVITHHGGENYETHGSLGRRAGLYFYTQYLIDTMFARADVVVSPSEGYTEESRALSTYDGDLRTIPNGIDMDPYDDGVSRAEAKCRLGFEPSDTVLLYLGSHHPRKGVNVLLDSFVELVGRRPDEDLRLVLAGSGQETDDLRRTATGSGAGDLVRFPGFVPETDKSLYMTAADLFVLPPVTAAAEVYPLVILEAAAGGTPVVASDFPTLRSVVGPNDIGRLVEACDSGALARTIEALVDDPAKLEVLSANARRFAEAHRWSRIAEEYAALYEELL
jgi:glycosyltransferase involved in cell wall biosynthesis